jgi:hypothetical protein
MIVSKSQKLDTGNPIDLRIKKSEDLRQSIASLQALFTQYSAQTKLMNTLELKIARELDFFYQGDNQFNGFVGRFSSYLKYKEELVKKEMSLFEKDLNSIRNYDKSYETMRPFVKNYFKHGALLTHYEEKLPKLIEMSEAKRKIDGKMSTTNAKRLMRNQKKLEDARISTLVATNNIIEVSNKLNLERFEKINPMISRFIQCNINITSVSAERVAACNDHEAVLGRKETSDFNSKFFIEMDPKQVERISRSHIFQSLMPDGGMQYKQNVQNNYYIVQDQNRPTTASFNNIPENILNQNQENYLNANNTSNINIPRQSVRGQEQYMIQGGGQESLNDLNGNLLSSRQPIALPYTS